MSEPVERESMEVDILYVGAGPATLASALHLMSEIESYNSAAEKSGGTPIEEPTILIIEKSAEIGDHALSGGVMNPIAIRELVPDFEKEGFPTEYVCTDDSLRFFLPRSSFRSPITPPPFKKKGYHVVSLSNVVKWLAERAEAAGIEIYPGFAGDEILVEDDRVIGVRTGDMGIDKNGQQKSNFQPGMDILAKVTVLGEGVRGSLTKQVINRFGLHGTNPETFETGVKEIWKVKPEKHKPGRVIHGMGFPNMPETVGGMWLYDMKDNLISFGVVTALDYENPNIDPHEMAQRTKTHPFMQDILEGAELIRYGAKTLPTGGLYSQPKLYTNGAVIVGDAASFCNAEKLTGIHMAIKSGMLAAEAITQALAKDDFSSLTLGRYTELYRDSWAYEEHWKSRNFHGSMERGLPFFMLNQPFRDLTNGRGLIDPLLTSSGEKHMKKLADLPPARRNPEKLEFDGKTTFNKEHLVGFSGTQHEGDQPSHLVVADVDLCRDVCTEEYGNPCENFCPAAVYEMVSDTDHPGKKKLFIHHENCVHCKTCDIADPYQIINWTPPEGGEGPDYTNM